MSRDCLAARMKPVSRAITEAEVCSPSARKKTERVSTNGSRNEKVESRKLKDASEARLPRGATDQAMTKLKKRAFDGEEQNSGAGVDADLDADQRGNGRQGDGLGGAELRDEMDDKFLNEVSAVGDARDEGGTGDLFC